MQAAQVIAQGFFGIGFGPVVDEADGPLPATVANDPHHAEFLIALAQSHDFLSSLIAIHDHAVEVNGEQVRHHGFPHVGKAGEVGMAVVEIVDEAHVLDAVALEALDDADLIFGFAEPSAVIIEGHLATERSGGDGDWADPGGLRLDHG